MSENNIDFSFEFAVSIIITLVIMTIMIKKNPDMSTIVVAISGLAIAYISLKIINLLFPKVNKAANNIYQYAVYSMMTNFNNLGYLHVWPPIMAVLIIFIVLLYNRNLG
jgi:ABC-type Fe3+-siderophore transport system permease subunit